MRRSLITILFLTAAVFPWLQHYASAQGCGVPTASATIINTSCGNHGSLIVHWNFPGGSPENLVVTRAHVRLVFKGLLGNVLGERTVGASIGDARLPTGDDELPPASWLGFPNSTVELTASDWCQPDPYGSVTMIQGPTTVFTVPNYNSVCPPPPPPPPPPPANVGLFQFVLNSNFPDEKVLLHKYDSSDTSGTLGTGYESPYQLANNLIPPTVRIEGGVTKDGQPDIRDVYFRVVDPPDTAPYAPHVSGGDNLDPALPKGKLYCYDAAGHRVEAINGVLQAFSNHDNVSGRVRVFLETSQHVSGENYQLEASFEPTFTCAAAGPGGSNNCWKSVKFVTWKRIYVERDQMFRAGSFVTDQIMPGDFVIPVADIAPFGAPGTTVRVRLVHAPESAPLVASSGSFYSEDHTVVVVAGSSTATGVTTPAHLRIVDPGGVRNAYDDDVSIPMPHAFDSWLRDGVGVIGGTADFFTAHYGPVAPGASLSPVEGVFHAAFIQMRVLSQQEGDIPFAPPFRIRGDRSRSDDLARAFADKWCEQCTTVASSSERRSLSNRMHLLGGNEGFQDSLSGYTVAFGGGNYSWIFSGAVERNTRRWTTALHGLDPFVAIYENVAHELAHQWRVNAPSEHCAANAYSGDGTFCRMHEVWDWTDFRLSAHNPERADGKIEFHYTGSGPTADSEYLTIRRAAEPVPNN